MKRPWNSERGVITVRKLLWVIAISAVILIVGLAVGMHYYTAIKYARDARAAAQLNTALAQYKSLVESHDELVGDNSPLHHVRILQLLGRSLRTKDGIQHTFSAGKGLSASSLHSTGSGSSLWFVADATPMPPAFIAPPTQLTTDTNTPRTITLYAQSREPPAYTCDDPPDWLTVRPDGSVTIASTEAVQAVVTITAHNAQGEAHLTLPVSVTWAAPALLSPRVINTYTGSQVRYDVKATNGPFNLQASNLPPGLRLVGSSILGVPTSPGKFNAELVIRNPGVATKVDLLFDIKATPPIIKVPTSLAWPANQYSEFVLDIANYEGTSLVADGLPRGLSVDSPRRRIVGLANVLGSYLVALKVGNGVGTDEKLLRLEVQPSPPVTGRASVTISPNMTSSLFGYKLTGSGWVQADFPRGDQDIVGLTVTSDVTLNAVLSVSTQRLTWRPVARVQIATGQHYYALPETGNARFWRLELVTADPAVLSIDWHGQTLLTPKPVVLGKEPIRVLQANPLPFFYQVEATGAPTRYQFEGLPNGLVGDALSGRISGRVLETGTFHVAVTASNLQGSGFGYLQLDVK